jgi:hypothetical protein
MNRRQQHRWPVVTLGKNARPLKHPRAEWIASPGAFDLPPFVREHVFHPTRPWRFDYAWPEHRVALEVDGAAGAWGRHSRPGGMRADHEKLNTAAVMGWCVLRVLAGEEKRLSTLLTIHAALRRCR